jgi:hypothetical protein
MKKLIILFTVFTALVNTGCKKCTHCHIHGANNTKTETEVCGRGKDYNKAIDEIEALGYDCSH